MTELQIGIDFPKEKSEHSIILRLKNILTWWNRMRFEGDEFYNNMQMLLINSCKHLYENRNINDFMELQNLNYMASFENMELWVAKFLHLASSSQNKTLLEKIKNNEVNILKLIVFIKNIVNQTITDLNKAVASLNNKKINSDGINTTLVILYDIESDIDYLIKELNFEWTQSQNLGLYDLQFKGIKKITENLQIKEKDIEEIINNCFLQTISVKQLKDNLKLLATHLEKIKKEYQDKSEIAFLWKNKKDDDNHLGKLLNNLDIRHNNKWEQITQVFKDIKNNDDYLAKLKQTRNLIYYAMILIYS